MEQTTGSILFNYPRYIGSCFQTTFVWPIYSTSHLPWAYNFLSLTSVFGRLNIFVQNEASLSKAQRVSRGLKSWENSNFSRIMKLAGKFVTCVKIEFFQNHALIKSQCDGSTATDLSWRIYPTYHHQLTITSLNA